VRNELWSITNTPQWKSGISSKLPHCKWVSCVGHSLGGALCELFTLCANSNHKGHPDYDALAWEPGKYEQMPELSEWDVTRLWDERDREALEAARSSRTPLSPSLRTSSPASLLAPALLASWAPSVGLVLAVLAASVSLSVLARRHGASSCRNAVAVEREGDGSGTDSSDSGSSGA